MKRIKKPQENVEYVFRFPPKKKYTYRWFGDVEKGRILLFNVTKGYYTGMTPQYFTYLCQNRLVSKTIMQPTEKPATEEPAPKKTEKAFIREPEVLSSEEEKAFIQNAIKKLSSISENNRRYLKTKFAERKDLEVKNLIDKFNVALKGGVSDEEFTNLMGSYIAVTSTLDAFLSRLGGCI